MIETVSGRYLSATIEEMPTAMANRQTTGGKLRYPATHPHDVASRIGDLQRASFALARELDTVHEQETASLARKLQAIDSQAAGIARRAARTIGNKRQLSIAVLNSIFEQGLTPAHPLDGEYRGELLTTTMSPALDAFSHLMSKLYLPWLGKRFDSATWTGDNVFTPSARIVGHLAWPLYFGYQPYHDGLVTGFTFNTFTGPGVQDPGVTALKLDYDNLENPAFMVRTVLDEVVQITHNYYLGKAFIWHPGGFKLAAFFSLRESS